MKHPKHLQSALGQQQAGPFWEDFWSSEELFQGGKYGITEQGKEVVLLFRDGECLFGA